MVKDVNFYRKVLENGVTVIYEQRKTPVVAVATSIKTGAQHESLMNKGISHFMEHLVFKGTKKRKVDEIPREIESKGGIINAFTAEDVTCFWNKLPTHHFHLGADISRDLVNNPLFERKSLERERKVILEEINMYNDNPGSHVLENIKRLLYKKPFGLSIAGTHATVSSIKRDQIIARHKAMYSSNNIIFSAVGNVSWNEVLEEAKKFPSRKLSIAYSSISLDNGELIEKRKGIDQAHAVIGFHMPTMLDKKRYAAEVFDSILGGGMSSRLFQEVRERRGLCYAIKSNLEQSRDYAYEVIYVGTVAHKISLVKTLILKEIKKLRALSLSDLREAQERLIGLRSINKEKSDTTMIELLQEEVGGNAENYYDYEEGINKVKLSDVQSFGSLPGFSFTALVPQ